MNFREAILELRVLGLARLFFLILGLFAATPAAAQPSALVSQKPTAGAFPLAARGVAATIEYDPNDHPVVAHAAADLAGDIASVTGIRPSLIPQPGAAAVRNVVLIGTIGRSRLIDGLVSSGWIDPRKLKGTWESFVIATVRRPMPGMDSALVIAGSDPRGTAYGVYELSEAIGVSPWSWWADVPARKRDALWIAAGTRRFGPPSVKYRGIFINDEDWGLHPWAARTYESEAGGIGPKTYARVFELMLRLKANTLWPAMHKVSAPFNSNPENARLADRYAIVMGSSHAEPMLRNNVGEWQADPDTFNYATNREGVRRYWEERVRTNGRYENLWTLGMRGIHDSAMLGASTNEQKVALLQQAITDQRDMLARDVNPDVARVPQIFVPYKEVLDVYRRGLRVPDDVTIVWPDDNFGYIRHFPTTVERARPGGSGVYYHLSYYGGPLSYLWLSTTPPALVNEEMTRAWDAGARAVWIVNVGDIKPAEIGTSAFFEMAWNVDRWRGKSQHDFLENWSERTFGSTHSKAIADLLNEHFALNWERRPEHLQWWVPPERPTLSSLSEAAVADRLARFDKLTASLDHISSTIPAEQADAFFELVDYPVRVAAEANRRYFALERYARWLDAHPAEAHAQAALAAAADARIKALTRRFNEDVAGGKWRFVMAEEPADNQGMGFRIAPLALPAPGLQLLTRSAPAVPQKAERCETSAGQLPLRAAHWQLQNGLGRSGRAMVAARPGATLVVDVAVPSGCGLSLALVPTYPTTDESAFTLRASAAGQAPVKITIGRETGDRDWAHAVLANRLVVPLPTMLAPGVVHLTITADQPGLAIDQILAQPIASPSGTIHSPAH